MASVSLSRLSFLFRNYLGPSRLARFTELGADRARGDGFGPDRRERVSRPEKRSRFERDNRSILGRAVSRLVFAGRAVDRFRP